MNTLVWLLVGSPASFWMFTWLEGMGQRGIGLPFLVLFFVCVGMALREAPRDWDTIFGRSKR